MVIYFHTDHQREGQRTAVTETRGPFEERRVVRGRETECREHYANRNGEAPRDERPEDDKGG